MENLGTVGAGFQRIELRVDELSNGQYIYKITNGSETLKVDRFMVRK